MKHDGYCLTRDGEIYEAYFHADKKQVIKDAVANWGDILPRPSWAGLRREGFNIQRVKVVKLRVIQ